MRIPIVDYYAVLGVHPSAEDVVIRAAYKALAQRYHPDRFAGSKDEAHRRMSELSKAYEVLADPMRRPKYDRRRRFTHPRSAATGFGSSPKVRFSCAQSRRRSLGRGDAAKVPNSGGDVDGRRRRPLGFQSLPLFAASQGMAGRRHRDDPKLAHQARQRNRRGTGDSQGEPSPSASAVPAAMTPASTSSVKERSRAETRSASIDRPAKNAPAALGAAKTKTAPPPAGTCSQQQLLLGLCN